MVEESKGDDSDDENLTKLPYCQIKEMIDKKLDPFETQRLCDKLRLRDDAMLSHEETVYAFEQLLEEDVDDLIFKTF